MKKFLLLLLLLLAAAFVLRDQLWPGVHPNSELAPTAREADLATGKLTAAAATPTSTGAIDPTRTERRAAAGSLRVRALAQAKDGTTAPLPDLLVLAFPGEGSHEPVDGIVHRLRTDERGEAVFASLQPGTFSVRAPSVRVATQHAVVAASGEALAELRIEGADVVRGIVVAENGAPVEGADLWLVRDTRSDEFGVLESLELRSRRAGRSNANGTFAVLATDPSERRIAASHELHGESMARYVQGGRHELRLVLQPATARLTVQVTDQHDRPVPDAEVAVRVGNDAARRTRDGTLVVGRRSRTARTDEQGRCTFANLPTGGAQVTAAADPHGRSSHDLVLHADAPNELALHLVAHVLVHGRVRCARGLPATTVVRIQPSRNASGQFAECTVRPDGSYRLVAPAQQPFVVAVALGLRTLVDREFEDPAPGRLRCDFVVDDAAATTGTVRTTDGLPLGSWRVRLSGREGSSVEAVANARGEFAMTTRFAGPATAQVFAPGASTEALARDGIELGEDLALIVPHASLPRGRVLGRVTDASGAPAAFSLRLRCRSPRVQHDLVCATDGSFSFDGLVALQWTLEHLHHGNATVLKDGIALGDGDLRDLGAIALPATGRVQVEVIDEFGRPFSGSTVGFALFDERGTEVSVDHVTIDGRLAVEAAPGKHWLGAHATDLLCERVPVVIETGRTGHARLSVRVGRTLRLRFASDAEGGRTEVRSLRVTIREARGGTAHEQSLPRTEVRVDQRAAWELVHTLAFGPHRIEAATEDGLRFAMDLDVTESFDTDPIVEVPIVR
ncbi:MAG: carboxypeptidase-like regulatory domain-containing protein [Planctomycetota bacterium]